MGWLSLTNHKLKIVVTIADESRRNPQEPRC